MIEDFLKDGVAMPVDQGNVHVCFIKPACHLVLLVILMTFIKNWLRIGKGLSAEVMAVVMESMLIQRLKKSKMDIIMPMQAMDDFVLDLCVSSTSMLFLVLAILSLIPSCSTMHAFLLGRKAEGLMEFAFDEGGDSIGSKISTQHMCSQGLADHLDG
jgi:hypothetical protein